MTEKGKNTPTVRFKGFTDDWEQRKLGDLVDVCSGKDYKHLEPGDIPVFGTGGYMLSVNEALSYDKDAIGIGRKGTIDKPYILKAPFWTVDTLFYAIPRDSECLNFSNYIFQNINWRKKDESTGVPSLSKNAINNTLVEIPNRQEQLRIGKYLGTLDHLSTLHQRHLDEQKALKKYFLQNMFPAKGEKVPRIRFQGFTGDWEQRKLGDVADSFEYGLNAAAKEFDGANKYIRITDIDDSTHEFLPTDLTSPDTVIEQADNYKLDEGDILFARTGASVGKTYIYKQSDGLVYYAGFLIRARINKKYDPEFIFQNTLTPDYDKYIRITSQRSGQPGVNAQEYADYELMIPRIDEQKRIGEFLRNLDDLITLHQRQLTQLQAIKKFMLQNLFV